MQVAPMAQSSKYGFGDISYGKIPSHFDYLPVHKQSHQDFKYSDLISQNYQN